MAGEKKTLRNGRVFEKLVLGSTMEVERVEIENWPELLSFDDSMQEVIVETWKRYSQDFQFGKVVYDPRNPTLGETSRIFEAVKKYLPRKVQKRKSCELHLYISVGMTSLDWYYGVDAFFWWEGVYTTIDVSIAPKKEMGELKANFLFGPSTLQKENLETWGKQVAEFMKERRRLILHWQRLYKKESSLE